jgi:hypothetical protein
MHSQIESPAAGTFMLTHAMSEGRSTRPEMLNPADDAEADDEASNLTTTPPLQQRSMFGPSAQALVMRSKGHGQTALSTPPRRTSEAVTWK